MSGSPLSRRRAAYAILAASVGAACQAPPPTAPDIEQAEFPTPAGFTHSMALVPAGPFVMGSEYGDKDEFPPHEVYLDAYYIDKVEVTNARYLAFANAVGAARPLHIANSDFDDPEQPVVGVEWRQATDYCRWAGGMSLPTEAQWEKAARGVDGRVYPWGQEAPSPLQATFGAASGGPAKVGTHPAGASPYGLLDMAGNVWEQTSDNYRPDWYSSTPNRNPRCVVEPWEDSDHTIRGGSWASPPEDLRASRRQRQFTLMGDFPEARVGFRCARAAD